MLAVVTDYSAEKTQMIKILLMPNIKMRIDTDYNNLGGKFVA
jgi:hypothetical protein